MSTDNKPRSPSPPGSSGRDSPATRPPRRQLEDERLRQDKSYRRYAANIERALASFDAARLEWPDYISFLGRLLKAIQGHPPATDALPHKFAVANRLAQCLKPSLPSGVHQKAIEVYSYVFSLIGKHTLSSDLHVYLPGLSAVLTFASLSLRPSFLSLFETHILVLDRASLTPALKALILCLLPGLEDETSEEFDRTFQIVDSLKEATNSGKAVVQNGFETSGDEYFWQCFFLASISSPSKRQGALAFLSRRLPTLSKDSMHDQTENGVTSAQEKAEALSAEAESVVSPESGLLIRCLAAGLEDEQMLVQRGFLDLLLSHLPLDSPVLTQRTQPGDLVRLVGAASMVVTRRDMSLNRRLWSWFLGPSNVDIEEVEDVSSSPVQSPGSPREKSLTHTAACFSRYGADPLTKSILEMFQTSSLHPTMVARPFRVCLSLMDRLEVGGVIVPRIFAPAIRSIFSYREKVPLAEFQEALRSANSFFDGIESGTIWSQILEICAKSMNSAESTKLRYQNLHLATFILDNFNVMEEEMLTVHMPLVSAYLLTSVSLYVSSKGDRVDEAGDGVVNSLLFFVEKLLHLMPERASLNSSFAQNDVESDWNLDDAKRKSVLSGIRHFYVKSKGNLSSSPPPMSSKRVGGLLLAESAGILLNTARGDITSNSIALQARVVSMVITKLPDCDQIEFQHVMTTFHECLSTFRRTNSKNIRIPFGSLNAVTQVLSCLVRIHPEEMEHVADAISSLVSSLVVFLWDFLSPSYPKYHMEAVRCLWQLDELVPEERVVEATIAGFLVPELNFASGVAHDVEPARRFAVLWTHTTSAGSHHGKRSNSVLSKAFTVGDPNTVMQNHEHESRLHRPLLLLLDSCDAKDSDMQYFVRGWLDSLPNIQKVFEIMLRKIWATQASEQEGFGVPQAVKQSEHDNQNALRLYYLQHLSNLLDSSSENLWSALVEVPDTPLGRNTSDGTSETWLRWIAQTCLQTVQVASNPLALQQRGIINSLQRTALVILQLLCQGPDPSSLQSLELENTLIAVLRQSLQQPASDASCQVTLLDTLLAALRLRNAGSKMPARPPAHRRTTSLDAVKKLGRSSINADSNENVSILEQQQIRHPPPDLVKCLQEGISSASSVYVLDNWIQFMVDVLPLYESHLFRNMIPLVEVFCRRLGSIFQELNATFQENTATIQISPEPALIALLTGLEFILATGHEQMAASEPKRTAQKPPEPQQGFFGNVVSGVFSADVQKGRPSAANTRLTVILCFQDALRICLSMWAWGGYAQSANQTDPTSLASYAYVSQRLRNKARRILDRMFMAEPLECLETLAVAWAHSFPSADNRKSSSIGLLHVLEASSPRHTMPALFNSIYSRTNPSSIDAIRMSTLTSDLTDLELAQFLVEYTESLDDDAMDEIWADCMTFLRDVLMNPLPHHQILPSLLLFLVILAEKVDKTNFGEQRKMRKELADLFLRLLTATFTTRPAGSQQDSTPAQFDAEKAATSTSLADPTVKARPSSRTKSSYTDFIDTLSSITPRLNAILTDMDRMNTAVSSIIANVFTPLVHSKAFPENMRPEYLTLWYRLAKHTDGSSKAWKREISEAFLSPRFFSATDPSLALSHWAPLLREWCLSTDRDQRISDLCARIAAPAAAGIVFGVGASAARLDADKKTQLNLRRIAFLLLAAGDGDFAGPAMPALEEKIAELLHATTSSSPSAATRAEVFMLLRALALSTDPQHLASTWPVVTAELQKALVSAIPGSQDFDAYTAPSLLQACRLLDLLLALNPDDFLLHEWLFVTDTPPRGGGAAPVALVDDIANELGGAPPPAPQAPRGQPPSRLLLRSRSVSRLAAAHAKSKEEFVRSVLWPRFFARLSAHAYDGARGSGGGAGGDEDAGEGGGNDAARRDGRELDVQDARRALVEDLFDDETLVS